MEKLNYTLSNVQVSEIASESYILGLQYAFDAIKRENPKLFKGDFNDFVCEVDHAGAALNDIILPQISKSIRSQFLGE